MCVHVQRCVSCVRHFCSELWGATARLPLPADSDIERCMGQHRIKCLASGALGDVHKFYFFAEVRSRGHIPLPAYPDGW